MGKPSETGNRAGAALVLGGACAGYFLFQKLYVQATGTFPGDLATATVAIVIGCGGATLLRRSRDSD